MFFCMIGSRIVSKIVGIIVLEMSSWLSALVGFVLFWQLAMASMTGMDTGDGQGIDVGQVQSKFKVTSSSLFESSAWINSGMRSI